MRYKTIERLGVGGMVAAIVLNIAIFVAIGWVAWHFIKKFW